MFYTKFWVEDGLNSIMTFIWWQSWLSNKISIITIYILIGLCIHNSNTYVKYQFTSNIFTTYLYEQYLQYTFLYIDAIHIINNNKTLTAIIFVFFHIIFDYRRASIQNNTYIFKQLTTTKAPIFNVGKNFCRVSRVSPSTTLAQPVKKNSSRTSVHQGVFQCDKINYFLKVSF